MNKLCVVFIDNMQTISKYGRIDNQLYNYDFVINVIPYGTIILKSMENLMDEYVLAYNSY